MNELNRIKILIEDFKSNNHASWIKFEASRLWNKSKTLWDPLLENSEIMNLLDEFISQRFKFEPLGNKWVEQTEKEIHKTLVTCLSHNPIHGYDEWSKEKAKELTQLILESFKGKVRYFSNIKSERIHIDLRHNDYRDTDHEYGVIIYDLKNICGIWVSLHDDPHLIKVRF